MEEQNKKLFYILMFFAMIGWGASWVHAKVLSTYINEYVYIMMYDMLGLRCIEILHIYIYVYIYVDRGTGSVGRGSQGQ